MSYAPGLRRRRPAYTDLAPAKRHDGSLDGYRRQRRQHLQRRHDGDAFLPVRILGRTQ